MSDHPHPDHLFRIAQRFAEFDRALKLAFGSEPHPPDLTYQDYPFTDLLAATLIGARLDDMTDTECDEALGEAFARLKHFTDALAAVAATAPEPATTAFPAQTATAPAGPSRASLALAEAHMDDSRLAGWTTTEVAEELDALRDQGGPVR
jgi:hypothetical protein